MAVCLASIVGQHIVVCSDQSPATVLETSDEIIQDRELPYGFRLLVAGAKPVADAIDAELTKSFDELGAEEVLDVNQALHRGLRAYKKFCVDEYFHAHYGHTYDQFRSHEHLIPEAIFKEEIEKARDWPLAAELLIVGFLHTEEEPPEPLILYVSHGWAVETYTDCFAIGEASILAHQSLLTRGVHHGEHSLDEVIYISYEAKKYAENAPSVGTQTTLTVYGSDESPQCIDTQGEAYLAKLYGRFGPRPLSEKFSVSDLPRSR